MKQEQNILPYSVALMIHSGPEFSTGPKSMSGFSKQNLLITFMRGEYKGHF